jgi:hypothetical protein
MSLPVLVSPDIEPAAVIVYGTRDFYDHIVAALVDLAGCEHTHPSTGTVVGCSFGGEEEMLHLARYPEQLGYNCPMQYRRHA